MREAVTLHCTRSPLSEHGYPRIASEYLSRVEHSSRCRECGKRLQTGETAIEFLFQPHLGDEDYPHGGYVASGYLHLDPCETERVS